jgi:hypothetical protein
MGQRAPGQRAMLVRPETNGPESFKVQSTVRGEELPGRDRGHRSELPRRRVTSRERHTTIRELRPGEEILDQRFFVIIPNCNYYS